MKNFKNIKRNSGAAMLISVIFFLFISLAIVFGLISPGVREIRNSTVDLSSKKSYFLAESGSEDAMYRIITNKTISGSETISLDSNSVTTTITTLLGNIKQIVSLGDVSSYQRKNGVVLRTGDGAIFKYGTQAGQGGFVFHQNSYVTGGLYSNGNIVGANGAYITGDAYVANESGSISAMCIGGIAGSSCAPAQGATPGNAYAVTVTNSSVTGNLYCVNGSGNNKACDTSIDVPTPQDLPISDEEIAQWKSDATNGGITNSSVTISNNTTLGAQKIIGNLTVNGNKTLTLADTIYVTGNIILAVGSEIKLASSYGATSGVIITDGYIIINNNVVFTDSGTAGSYLLLLSTSNCDISISASPCNGHSAIEVSNNSDISIVNAQNGTVYFANNAKVKESVGNKIELKNNVGITYGSGIINVNFTSGPSGSWVIGNWGETQ